MSAPKRPGDLKEARKLLGKLAHIHSRHSDSQIRRGLSCRQNGRESTGITHYIPPESKDASGAGKPNQSGKDLMKVTLHTERYDSRDTDNAEFATLEDAVRAAEKDPDPNYTGLTIIDETTDDRFAVYCTLYPREGEL